MPAEQMPEPPDARGVMDKLTILGNLFEQIEKVAGDVAAEVQDYKARYVQWEADVEAWAKRQAAD